MSQLFKRALSGIIFVGVLVFSILYSKITFISLFFVLMLFCLYEFKKMIELKSIFPYLIGIQFFIYGNVLNVEDLPSLEIFDYVGGIIGNVFDALRHDFSTTWLVILAAWYNCDAHDL